MQGEGRNVNSSPPRREEPIGRKGWIEYNPRQLVKMVVDLSIAHAERNLLGAMELEEEVIERSSTLLWGFRWRR